MKKRFILSLLTACWAVLLTAGCSDSDYVVDWNSPGVVHGNGIVVEESRTVGSFTRIDFRGVGKLFIQQGSREELRVRAEGNLLEYLWTDVQGGELLIWKDGVSLMNTRPIEFHLTVENLERLALSGAGWVRGMDLDTGPLAILLTGVGPVEFVNLNASGVDVETSGLGDVILSGTVQDQSVRLGGMGGYNGRDLASLRAEVRIGSGGSATVRVSDHLTATVEGSGNVYYIGDPVVESWGGGSGEVVKIGG